MNIINLTPHVINIFTEEEARARTEGRRVADPLTINPSGQVASIEVTRRLVQTLGKIPIYKEETGAPRGLPEYDPGTIYIVSGMFRVHVQRRPDLYQPGELLRDEKGRPIGCIGLSQ